MQLVAYGAQDIYLTGNPQITFFKVVYRRYTNFSMESIQQTWNGQANTNGRCTATISRNGDLVHKMFIQIDTTAKNLQFTSANPGHAWITDIAVEIGGQTIDKQYGSWLETWAELTQPNTAGQLTAGRQHSTGTNNNNHFDGWGTSFQRMTAAGGVQIGEGTIGANLAVRKSTNNAYGRYFYVPLQFWFNRNVGLSLPLIALQYHEVTVVLNHTLTNCFLNDSSGGTTDSATQQLWADYIYLDTDERRRFAQVSHEYLIEQLQMQTSTGNTIDLNFNHPVKELIWTGNWNAPDGIAISNDSVDGLNNTLLWNTDNPVPTPALGGEYKPETTYLIKLNGQDRFAARPITYFTKQQVETYHTGPGGLSTTESAFGQSTRFNDSIAVYSFALNPEEHQPSGTCNFSRIDTAQLIRSAGANTTIYIVYAVNYNVLRIMSGMGGLAYSN